MPAVYLNPLGLAITAIKQRDLAQPPKLRSPGRVAPLENTAAATTTAQEALINPADIQGIKIAETLKEFWKLHPDLFKPAAILVLENSLHHIELNLLQANRTAPERQERLRARMTEIQARMKFYNLDPNLLSKAATHAEVFLEGMRGKSISSKQVVDNLETKLKEFVAVKLREAGITLCARVNEAILETFIANRGNPYHRGGAGSTSRVCREPFASRHGLRRRFTGVDCSHLVGLGNAAAKAKLGLTPTMRYNTASEYYARSQKNLGQAIKDGLRPGDIICYRRPKPHCATICLVKVPKDPDKMHLCVLESTTSKSKELQQAVFKVADVGPLLKHSGPQIRLFNDWLSIRGRKHRDIRVYRPAEYYVDAPQEANFVMS